MGTTVVTPSEGDVVKQSPEDTHSHWVLFDSLSAHKKQPQDSARDLEARGQLHAGGAAEDAEDGRERGELEQAGVDRVALRRGPGRVTTKLLRAHTTGNRTPRPRNPAALRG